MSDLEARALLLLAPRQLAVHKLRVPDKPPAGGAVLKVLANGICGSDYDFYNGHFPIAMPLPLILGHEIVGELVTIDADAERTWGIGVGTRVAVEAGIRCGGCEPCRLGRQGCLNPFNYSATSVDVGSGLWGGMAEYMVLRPGSSLYPLPESMPIEIAALFNVFGNATEWTQRQGEVSLGDRVVILGAGQRGIACAAVAHNSGASHVVVTGLRRDAAKLALASQLGATATVDVEGRDTVEAVSEANSGVLADVVIDTTPRVVESLGHAIDLVRPEGTIVLAGLKHRSTDILTDRLIMKNVTVRCALGTKPISTVTAIRTLESHRLPYERLYSGAVGLDGVEHALQAVGGEHASESPIHVSVNPWS